MLNQQVTTFEHGWLVAAVDGEGCIGITRRNRHAATLGFTLKPHVQLTNCDRSFIERYCSILKKADIAFHVSHAMPKARRRERWNVVVAGLKRVVRYLPLLTEYLCDEKRDKARLTLEFCESRLAKWHAAPFSERELELATAVSHLNVRGKKIEVLNLRDYTPSSYSSKYRFTVAKDIVQTTTP